MSEPLSRRTLLRAAAGGAMAVAVGAGPATTAAHAATGVPAPVRELEEKIREAMTKYAIPGVALGLYHRGTEHVRGFGVTRVDDPRPVDGDTVFRIGSTTKTFTGTAVMRLAEQRRLDLDRTVRSYLPDFRTADAAASARVTVRQLLNHTAGWLGDCFLDTGTDDQALARYVAEMSRLPQLTSPGTVFAYNNAALAVAGRLVEVAAGVTYEEAIRRLILEPLAMGGSGFSLAEIPGAVLAVPHYIGPDGAPVADPALLDMPRSIHPAGGLIASARDQLRWARFQLGTGRPLLSRRSLRRMQTCPGPGGTLFVELDGMGVTWMIRPTAEGPTVIQHGGDWAGQHSGFLMVPERDFALTVLTNSESGPALLGELFADDWALSRFAGVHNLPAVTRARSAAGLAPYEGRYTAEQIGLQGDTTTVELDVVADAGQLSVRFGGQEGLRLAFYRDDYVRAFDPSGGDTYVRANFVRDGGSVAWLRFGGRLYRRGPAGAPRALRMPHATGIPTPMTLPYA
ncbi:serine hydrolase domain-containing protein [Krasilnikovia sp. MM14-A1259]|uniref:serine hydrolase domain-containing protein n=1 Tax=Krasilnikovia sp. MM14-A1259 TaxID=3373539 RepID=UPI0038300DBF